MFGIGQFFKRIQGSYAKELFIRSAIRDILHKNVGIDVAIEKILFKGNTVVLDGVSQTAKSVIFVKKQMLLKEIAAAQNVRMVSDIR